MRYWQLTALSPDTSYGAEHLKAKFRAGGLRFWALDAGDLLDSESRRT
jgi:hypothetical protein